MARTGRPPAPFTPGQCAGCSKEMSRRSTVRARSLNITLHCRSCANTSRLTDPVERYWSKVERSSDPNDCWWWTGAVDSDGYGLFAITHDRQIVASKYGLELKLGRPLLHGMKGLHTCDNPSCQNPAHLFEGDATDNMVDMANKGRSTAGVLVTSAVVQSIRHMIGDGVPDSMIADRIGVSRSYVYMIRVGKRRRRG